MNFICKCGKYNKPTISINSWIKNKCCNFIAWKYTFEINFSDYYLSFNNNYYWIDNDSLSIYSGNSYRDFLIEIKKIDESLSLNEIEKICIKYIENICFL